MKRSAVIGILLAGVLALFFVFIIGWTGEFGGFEVRAPQGIPFDVISDMLFNKYGALLLVLGGLMFGAIIAGVAISKEEEDE